VEGIKTCKSSGKRLQNKIRLNFMNFLCPSLSINVKHCKSRAQVSTNDSYSHCGNITLHIVEGRKKRFSDRKFHLEWLIRFRDCYHITQLLKIMNDFFFECFVLRGGWLIYPFLSSLSKPLMPYKYLYSDFPFAMILRIFL